MIEPNNKDMQYIHKSEYSLFEWNGPKKNGYRQRQKGIGVLIRDELAGANIKKMELSSSSFKGIDINEQLKYTYSYFAVNEYRICTIWTTKNKKKCQYLTCAGQLSFLLKTIENDINDKFVLIGDFNLKSIEPFDDISNTLKDKNLVDVMKYVKVEDRYTFSNYKGTKTCIDYIFTVKENVHHAEILEDKGQSDHRALHLELKLNG